MRIAAIEGPGACGIDYPLRVSALGESAPLSYDDEPVPPGAIPNGANSSAMPRQWPGAPAAVSSSALPPLQSGAPQSYPSAQPYRDAAYPATQVYPPPQSYPAAQPYPAPQPSAQIGAPLSLDPPGMPDDDVGIPGGPPHPYYGGPSAPLYSPAPLPSAGAPPPLGPPTPERHRCPRCRCKSSRRRRSPAR